MKYLNERQKNYSVLSRHPPPPHTTTSEAVVHARDFLFIKFSRTLRSSVRDKSERVDYFGSVEFIIVAVVYGQQCIIPIQPVQGWLKQRLTRTICTRPRDNQNDCSVDGR